jgi:DNA-binding response OmpR family regulator
MFPRALVVEDDAFTRNALIEILESDGCSVDSARDGEMGLGLLSQHRYDVVILDLVLPKFSGTDIMEQLLCTRPEVLSNIIVVTGLDVEEIRSLFPNVCEALGKPVMPKKLRSAVRKCLSSAAVSLRRASSVA